MERLGEGKDKCKERGIVMERYEEGSEIDRRRDEGMGGELVRKRKTKKEGRTMGERIR